jgi:hypothetical protein
MPLFTAGSELMQAMEHLTQINPFVEGRKAPSQEERKRLSWQKKQEQQEQREQQLRHLYFMGETHPKKILESID